MLKQKIKLIFLTLVILVSPFYVFAQSNQSEEKTVTGVIVDEQSETLIGVSVMISGTSIGTISDINGSYSIKVKEGDILNFSYIGMKKTSVRVDQRSVINVTLESDRKQIDEVVVIGYGTTTAKSLTTSVGSIKSEILNERPTTVSAIQGVAGKIAGVSVMTNSGRPDGKTAIKIRGTGSLNATNEPLYVIDGFVGGDLSNISPEMIESIDILKDAASAAIYGARGTNGVVVVTTKRGKKNTSQISYTGSLNFATLARQVEICDSYELAEIFKRAYEYKPDRIAPHLDPNNNFARKNELFKEDGTPIYNTNWQEECTRLAVSHNHSLSFIGGSDDMTVLANVSVKDNQGIMINSYRKQLNGFLNIGWQVKKWLHIQASMTGGANEGNYMTDQGATNLNETRLMLEMLPFFPIKYEDGTYTRRGDYPGAEEAENPVKMLKERKSIEGRQYTLGNFIATFKITPKINFVSTWGAESMARYRSNWSGNDIYDFSETQQGYATKYHWTNANWSNEDYISYSDLFGKHKVDLVAGASWYYMVETSTQAGSEGYFDNGFEYHNLGIGTVRQAPSSSRNERQMNSYYGRALYNFDERYYLGVTYRIDGSSNFGKNNKYAPFPSFSAAWRISNENFFKGFYNIMNNLKLRASWGLVGNSEIGSYRTLDQLNQATVVFSNKQEPAVVLGRLRNDNLRWEKSEQTNIGIDMGFLRDRIEIIADVYEKMTVDLLYSKALPATTGYSTAYDNIGSVRNRGIELSLTSWNIDRRNFKWRTTWNYTANRSKVININGDVINTWVGKIMEGEPLNQFYGYKRIGTWGTHEAEEAAVYGLVPGDIKFLDVNKDGKKDSNDIVVLGNGMPKFETNMSNYFIYNTNNAGSFDLSIDLQCMYGHSLQNFTRGLMENRVTFANAYKSALYESWTPENQNTVVPQLRLPRDGYANDGDSRSVEDGSFLRVRMVSLGYTFDKNLIRKIGLNELRMGITGENLFLFTNYTGYDPETTNFDATRNQGVDMYQYPKPRTISFNLSFNF